MWGKDSNSSTYESSYFFFLIIKSGDPKKIQELFARLRKEANSILTSIVELAWYMRGSIQYHDLMLTTPVERETMKNFLDKRFEKMQQTKTMFPVY